MNSEKENSVFVRLWGGGESMLLENIKINQSCC